MKRKDKKTIIPKKMDQLPVKLKDLVLEYISNGRNATQAYLTAYKNTTYATAAVEGRRWLKKPLVKEALEEYYAEIWKKKEKQIGLTFDRLIQVANADIANVANFKDGNLEIKDFEESETAIIHSITTISNKNGETKKIQLKDSGRAMSDLLKVLDMIKDKVEFEGELIIKPAIRPKPKSEEIE